MLSPIAPSHPVAIILPLHDCLDVTQPCLIAAMPGVLAVPNARLFAIIDPSCDPAMRDRLEQLVRHWPDHLIVQEGPAQLSPGQAAGLAQIICPDHDIVVLRPEAMVPGDWLVRLVEDAYSYPDIGTLIPLTSTASICGFPYPGIDNTRPFNLDIEGMNAAFRNDRLACVAAPATEGVCLYMRRAWLNAIADLASGMVEFSDRVGSASNGLSQGGNWINAVTPNLYIGHQGTPERDQDLSPKDRNGLAAVQTDPLRSARIYRHIRLLGQAPAAKILHVSHAMGGGVSQHIHELAAHFSQEAAHIRLSPHGEQGLVRISLGIGPQADQIILHPQKDQADLIGLLKSISITAVHIHHMMGLGPEILDLSEALGATCLVTVHDYYGLGGNITLTDRSGRYPGHYSPKLGKPARLLPVGPSPASLRAQFHRLVNTAEMVIFPSNATRIIFEQAGLLTNASVVTARHIEPASRTQIAPRRFIKKPIYKIGVLGAIGREKGADLLQQVAKRAKRLGLPLRFCLIGYANKPLQAVEASGPYSPEALGGLIEGQKLDLIFFPAQCPETYSYTLSSALACGLAIIAPNIGAFPERLSGRANTLIFEHLASVDKVLAQITAFIERMADGLPQTAPRFDDDACRQDFYIKDYISIASRRAIDASGGQDPYERSQLIRLADRSVHRPKEWRNALALWIWRLYTNPAMRWIGLLIPYTVLRFFKRALTRTSIHDLNKTKI